MLKYIALGLIALATPAQGADMNDIKEVHQRVNSKIKYKMDDLNKDSWDLPTKYGDCEDFALLKRQMLIDRGWDAEDLKIIIVKRKVDTEKLASNGFRYVYLHVVLFVKSKNVILDIRPQITTSYGAYSKNVRVENYERWMSKNEASVWCIPTNISLGNTLTAEQRCAKA